MTTAIDEGSEHRVAERTGQSVRWRRAYTPAAGATAAEAIERAQWAEALGFDDIWLADAGGTDALTLAGLVLAKTERVRVGIAVVPAYTRTPAVFAATLATLDSVAPGRFVLGLGSSSHAMIEGWHGMDFAKPLTLVKETTQLIQSMCRGEKSDFDGVTRRSHGYRQRPLNAPLPIHLAALRPKMIDTAVEIADGVILNLFPFEALPAINEQLDGALERHGRPRSTLEVGTRVQIAVTDDVDRARDSFRSHFVPYYANPSYNQFLVWAGRPDAAEGIRKGWAARDRAACYAALDDELVDRIAVIGSRSECQDRIRAMHEAGISTPMMWCLLPDEDIHRATFEAFAPENFTI